MNMKFDFSDLFNEIKKIKDFPKDIKDIEKEIVEAATSAMQKAIQQVYTENAPRLKGKAQRFVIPLPKLQNAVTTEYENGVVESYIDQAKLDRGSGANTNIFIDVNGDLIAKLWFYRRQHLRVTDEDKRAGRRHPEEYYVRDMDEYWQMPIDSVPELEVIKNFWTFRLNAIKSYYFDVIEDCKKTYEEIDKFRKKALAAENLTTVKQNTGSAFSQKELDDIFNYFIKVQNGEFKFNAKER